MSRFNIRYDIERTPRSGWGRSLWKFEDQVFKILDNLTKEGLLINHVTWTCRDEAEAHAVGTWLSYGDAATWYVNLEFVYSPAAAYKCRLVIGRYTSLTMKHPVLEYIVSQHGGVCITDRRLDIILEAK